jgi:hypothetical protein
MSIVMQRRKAHKGELDAAFDRLDRSKIPLNGLRIKDRQRLCRKPDSRYASQNPLKSRTEL